MSVSVQEADFDVGAEIAALTAGDACRCRPEVSSAGARCERRFRRFEMTLEHYPGMTEKALEAIVGEASSRWDIYAVRVIHRVGRLLSLMIASSCWWRSARTHRGEDLCCLQVHHGLPENQSPFWKREVLDGRALVICGLG